MIEDDVIAQSLARGMLRIVKAVDHREAVSLPVSEASAHQAARAAVGQRLAIFDQAAGDGRMLDHVGIIHLVHGGHAAFWMALIEIFEQQLELFIGRPRAAFGRDQITIAAKVAALGLRWAEFIGDHADRDAGLAINAAGAISNRLAAAETDPSKRLVQLVCMRALKLGEDLALAPPRQIGARRRARHEKAREAEWSCHWSSLRAYKHTRSALFRGLRNKGLNMHKRGL